MRKTKSRGVTLIELLIAVTVIAILGAIAYPSYQDHLRKSRRAEGKGALLKAAQVLERWYTDRNTYGNSPVPPAAPTSIDLALLNAMAAGATVYSGENPADNRGYYTISAAVCAGGTLNTCFTLTATPTTARWSGGTDSDCGNFTLTNTGVRGWSTGTNTNLCRW